jgi:hypothetical protein
MSQANMRFEELVAEYRAVVPHQRIRRRQRRDVLMAANLRQVVEMAVLENALRPGTHDRSMLDLLKGEARDRIVAASKPRKKRIDVRCR